MLCVGRQVSFLFQFGHIIYEAVEYTAIDWAYTSK